MNLILAFFLQNLLLACKFHLRPLDFFYLSSYDSLCPLFVLLNKIDQDRILRFQIFGISGQPFILCNPQPPVTLVFWSDWNYNHLLPCLLV